ncbi:hypothetical protein [Clostridium uliginosum]|uniref:Uncharacterized protein n=1 Tax=Clostridium uliginosum TaxID=119641 RepID=A0A1I1PI42_9CLOT|nr:hypothetical protein [Clostridium uliginosum]SFD09485.1 hypothetical protein SAMN05421842_11956 [Clostridium uliginosum]
MDKNIEMMKKIIEEKKKKGLTKNNKTAERSIGSASKGKKNKKPGGVFDK